MLLRSLDAMVARFAALFEPAPALPQRQRWEIPLLLAILSAAAVLRFWGLGAVGLHGDEEIMGLATRSLLEDGSSRMPSGMFYPRAIVQIYLMAASSMAFGLNEWALRLPSVFCGLLLIVLAYLLGRRFLFPRWNLAFVAIVAFLPSMIADSQEARMYIFLLACLAAYAVLLFEWEKTAKSRYLVAAVLVLLIGIQFHELAVFGAFLAVFPGLVRGDRNKLLAGIGAFGAIGLGHKLISDWIDAAYPDRPFSIADGPNEYALEVPSLEPTPGALDLLPQFWHIAVVLLLAGVLAIFVARKVSPRLPAVIAGTLLFLGLVAQAGLYYHAALVLLIAGAAVAQRNGGKAWSRLAVLLAVSAAAAIGHIVMLHLSGVSPLRRVFGAMVGQPSIWPMIQLGAYSHLAWLLAWAGFGWALWRLVAGKRIPEYWLFFVLGVWIPLALVGFFSWYVPPRYTEFALLPLILAALASLQHLGALGASTPSRPWVSATICTLVCVAVINPFAFIRTVNAGYAIHPDHKGAAEYIQSIKLGPKDILIAEDVLQQTYYLRHVDYSLVARYVAASFVEQVDGKILNMYTHVPVIGTGDELLAVLRQPDRGTVYVIGSGESQEDGRRFARGLGIFEVLNSRNFEVVYDGRDGLTKVWKARAPEQPE